VGPPGKTLRISFGGSLPHGSVIAVGEATQVDPESLFPLLNGVIIPALDK
jgi:hypothetical protein